MPKIFVLLLLSLGAPLWGQSSPPPEILKAEIQELKAVVRTLREENRKLENRNDQLMLDVVSLGRKIRSLQSQLEANAKTEPRPSMEEVTERASARPEIFQAIYVNPTSHYLLVDAGSDQGIAIGDTGSVIREGEIIAKIKMSDVKPNQSVADIDLNSLEQRGVYPRKNDQVRFP